MEKKLKKGDGLATIIITIVLVVIVLLIIPAFRNMQKQNSNYSKQIDDTVNSSISGMLEVANGPAGFDKIL